MSHKKERLVAGSGVITCFVVSYWREAWHCAMRAVNCGVMSMQAVNCAHLLRLLLAAGDRVRIAGLSPIC